MGKGHIETFQGCRYCRKALRRDSRRRVDCVAAYCGRTAGRM